MTKSSVTIKAGVLAAAAMLAWAPMATADPPSDDPNQEQNQEEQNQDGAPKTPDLSQGQQQIGTVEDYIEQQRAQGKNGLIYIVNGAPRCVLYGEVTAFGDAVVTIPQPAQYC